MKRQYIYSIAAGAALLLAACATDMQEQTVNGIGDGKIQFDATVAAAVTRAVTTGSMMPQQVSGYKSQLWLIPSVATADASPLAGTTRGTQLNSESTLAAFGVSAYKHSNLVDITNAKPDYFYNKKVTKDDVTGKYGFAQDYYWPTGDEYLSFYAYYPYNSMSSPSADDDNTLVSLTAATQTGPQQVTVSISDDVTAQVDFMTATAINQTPAKTTAGPPAAEPTVALAFQHQLCGIRFKIGDQFPTKGYIQKITLKNVYKQGTYTIGAEAASAWTYGDRDDFEVEYSIDRAVTTPGSDVTNDSETFLMIPYTFPDNSGASMEIQFWAGDQTYTVTASLDGHVWEAGKTVTYSLSSQNLTTLKIQSIGYYQYSDATVNNAVPVKAWANGDQVGMYVVQGYDADGHADGRTLRYANVPVTYNGTTGKWTIAQVSGQPVIKYPGDSYYFYYPYTEGGPAGYPNECNTIGADAETFFASVITAHTVATDQSTFGNFTASDLQVAKAVTPEENNDLPASTISATLSRKVGLAFISLGSATANKSITFTNGVAGTPTTASVTASSTFSGNIPYNNSTSYCAYVKANTATSFSSATYSSTNKDAWEASLVFTIAAGESDSKTAYSDRKNWEYVNAIWNYEYSGKVKKFTTPVTEVYTIQCWGAQGGGAKGNGNVWSNTWGLGGYTIGDINLTADDELFVCVGGKGTDGVINSNVNGGWNGGGRGSCDDGDDDAAGGGGGATDIRLDATAESTTWNTFSSLLSRIMVAAGGGGLAWSPNFSGQNGYGSYPGYGGGLSGGNAYRSTSTYAQGATQEAGGGFGFGQDGVDNYGNVGMGGGGSGYFGGRTSSGTSTTNTNSASGGSSFISGLTGCQAYESTSTSSNMVKRTGDNATIHYSGKVFTNASTIAGNTSQTQPDGTSTTGHTGNGYARITLTRW